MSNNSPDYENNLVFPPQEIKSQHELSEQGRQSDVLISAIERCEMLEKKLDIAIKALEHYSRKGSWAQKAISKIKELDK